MGESSAGHFRRLEPGSTVIVHHIEPEAVPKVRERAQAVKSGVAPQEALRSYKALNKLLREDNAVGILRGTKHGAIILRFPGREDVAEAPFVSMDRSMVS